MPHIDNIHNRVLKKMSHIKQSKQNIPIWAKPYTNVEMPLRAYNNILKQHE